eukprot:EG_transcript_32275
MNVFQSGLKKGLGREKDAEKEELLRVVKELRERITTLEHDNDVLVGENLALQEQLEQERLRNYELCRQRVEEKRTQLSQLTAEERALEEQRELLQTLGAEIARFGAETKAEG